MAMKKTPKKPPTKSHGPKKAAKRKK